MRSSMVRTNYIGALAAVILTIVVGSAVITFYQEYSASNAVEKLRAQVTIKANLLRDGKTQPVPAEEVVPGDITLLSAGSLIPADGVVLEARDFFVNQAHWSPIIADLLGLVPRPVTRTEGACASSALSFREGVLAIASGLYDIVLVGGFEQMSRRTTEEVAEGLGMAASPYEVAAGFTFPGVFGTMATAYFAKYGADREALFNVTIKSHNNAPPEPQSPVSL